MIGLMARRDPLLLAKSLLAQEFPMYVVAHQVGLPISTLRKTATRENWLRRSRRDAYAPAIRLEALQEYERQGSVVQAARALGVHRRTLGRWLRDALTPPVETPIVWRCYTCGPSYGVRVEGNTCSGCGEVRQFGPCEDDARPFT